MNSDNEETDPALSSDGRVLMFSAKRSTDNRKELWWSTRPSLDAPWSARQKLDGRVNSSFDNFAPTLSADGQTLIFASYDRTAGQGKNDLWMTRRVLKQ